MPVRGKFFELLDILRFARPNVMSMDVTRTANYLRERLGGQSFMSYGQIWPRISDIVKGALTADKLELVFSSYSDEWKNRSIQECVALLIGVLGGKGNWYVTENRPKHVLGVGFRPSIKGYWFYEGQAYAVMINARKGQPILGDGIKFLGRGIHELYCRDDPNNPLPMIIDLSEDHAGYGRRLKVYVISEPESTSLPQFEACLAHFFASLKLAGVQIPEAPADGITDLFRR